MEMSLQELASVIRGPTALPAAAALGGSEWKIVICQRAFVFVGRVSMEGPYLVLRDSFNVRVWGTTRGLGELAANGPIREKTKLDASGTVRVHELSVVSILDCDDARWRNATA